MGNQASRVLFVDVNVFDGVHEDLLQKANVLVEGNLIRAVSSSPMSSDGAEVIDGGGRTLMPGLSDAHVHLTVNDTFERLVYGLPQVYVGALAAVNARAMLHRGFTTVRDVGGPAIGLKMAVDEGAVEGPRILPSGAFISQSAGHGDFDSRISHLSPYFAGALDKAAIHGWTVTADGVPEVTKAAREVLRSGATQLKVMASGSITGAHDPLDVTEYTPDEMRAIVMEAAHWGTYAMVHSYTDESIRISIDAGIRSIEHGLFADADTMQMMKDKGVWFSTQFMAFSLTAEQAGLAGTPAEAKYDEAKAGARRGWELAKEAGVRMAWGTDAFGSLAIQALQPNEFLYRAPYFTPFEILKQTTSDNAELFALSGKRHPYQEGPLGVVQEGAYADLLLVNGNPLDDIALLAKPESNLALIMKDGTVFKDARDA